VLGTAQCAGGGCPSPRSVLHKSMVGCLVRKGDEVVILDMEAGTEHLSRGTPMDVDLMLAVHKLGERSVETAQRIRKRSANLGIRRFAMMLSR